MGKWGYKNGPRIRDAAGKRLLAEIVPTLDEEWRPVPGWEEFFSVSSCGRVRRDADGKLVSQSYKGQDGYIGLRLVHGARSYNPLTATIVAAAFLGPKPVGMQIDHKDGIKTNNFASNLEYVSHRVNHKRTVDMELHAWGERHGGAKLTDQKVREIRASKDTERVLAARYGVGDTTIHNVRSGHTWAHLTDDNASLYTGLHPICCTCCVELAKIKAGSQDPDSAKEVWASENVPHMSMPRATFEEREKLYKELRRVTEAYSADPEPVRPAVNGVGAESSKARGRSSPDLNSGGSK